jgi:hypothetical protein
MMREIYEIYMTTEYTRGCELRYELQYKLRCELRCELRFLDESGDVDISPANIKSGGKVSAGAAELDFSDFL